MSNQQNKPQRQATDKPLEVVAVKPDQLDQVKAELEKASKIDYRDLLVVKNLEGSAFIAIYKGCFYFGSYTKSIINSQLLDFSKLRLLGTIEEGETKDLVFCQASLFGTDLTVSQREIIGKYITQAEKYFDTKIALGKVPFNNLRRYGATLTLDYKQFSDWTLEQQKLGETEKKTEAMMKAAKAKENVNSIIDALF